MLPCTVLVFKVSDQLVPLREWLLTLTRPSKHRNLVAAARIQAVDATNIDRAVRYRSAYLKAPAQHVVDWPSPASP